MLHSLDCILAKLIQQGIIEINFQYLMQETIYSRFFNGSNRLETMKK